MTPDEYYRKVREEGAPVWARLIDMVKAGKHPTPHEIGEAVFLYGIVPASEAAEYVANLLAGYIKRPKTSARRPRKVIPAASSLKWLYQMDLLELQLLKKNDPAEYLKRYGTRTGTRTTAPTPSAVARKRLKEEFGLGADRVRRLKKK